MKTNAESRAATRTMTIFELFAASGRPQTLSELAREMAVPLSTCHGLVKTLQRMGYLYGSAGSRRIYPTRRLHGVARRIAVQDPLVEAIRPLLESLRDATGETVILGARQDDAIVYLDVVEGPGVIRYSAEPGDLKPFHSSAIGKVMLGRLAETELRVLLQRLDRPAITENTITGIDALVEEIAASRQRGFYVTRGENVSEVMAIAAPLTLAYEVFGVAVAGPIERVARCCERHRDQILTATARMAEALA